MPDSATASAPGRLDVMGGFADYSGSLVLETPVRERAVVTVRRLAAREWRAVTRQDSAARGAAERRVPLDGLRTRDDFLRAEGRTWASYALGCAWMLHETHGAPLEGLEFSIDSSVPAGKGVSSSAALEVATMVALTRLLGLPLDGVELAKLCQRVENDVVGAPCGLMDQLTCHLGRAGALLPILCQPDQVLAPVKLPEGWRVGGIDSNVRHSVGAASYTEVRTAAFMGYSILAGEMGVTAHELRDARNLGDRQGLWKRGYLAQIPAAPFARDWERLLPARLRGADFLRLGLPSIDPVTRVDPKVTYAVRACTAHPIREHARVTRMLGLLLAGSPDPTEIGHLMAEAHQGYTDCGIGDATTDHIATRVREAGISQGLLGAKISGGGNGGTVCVLYRGAEGERNLHHIADGLAAETGAAHHVFTGSSEGAAWSADA